MNTNFLIEIMINASPVHPSIYVYQFMPLIRLNTYPWILTILILYARRLVEVLPNNRSQMECQPKRFVSSVGPANKLIQRFHLGIVVLVKDRGTLTRPQIGTLKDRPEWMPYELKIMTLMALHGHATPIMDDHLVN